VETIHRGGDVFRQVYADQACSLRAVERHELKGNRQTLFECEFFAKQRLDGVVEVDAARLEFGTEGLVNSFSRAVFDLMPNLGQEFEVIDVQFLSTRHRNPPTAV
jgi:hypothetical protein